MTHDPLCPVGVKPWEDTDCCQTCNPGETPSWEHTCQCALIAKVRADERKRVGLRRNNVWDDAYAAALRDAVETLREANLFSRDYFLAVAAIEALGEKR